MARNTGDRAAGGAVPARLGGQVRVPKAAEIVAGALRREIVRNSDAGGTPLPSEAELMARFGVSRPTLREAIRILESEQLITINRGAKGGAVLHKPSASIVTRYLTLLLQFEGTTVGEIYRVHAFLEPSAARLVAERADASAVQELRACLDEAKQHLDNDSLFGKDTAHFRNKLIELAGIPTLTLLAGVLNEILENSWASVTAVAGQQVNNKRAKQRGVKSIETLIALIEAGDAEGAERHWRQHSDTVEQTMRTWLDSMRVIDLLEDNFISY